MKNSEYFLTIGIAQFSQIIKFLCSFLKINRRAEFEEKQT